MVLRCEDACGRIWDEIGCNMRDDMNDRGWSELLYEVEEKGRDEEIFIDVDKD